MAGRAPVGNGTPPPPLLPLSSPLDVPPLFNNKTKQGDQLLGVASAVRDYAANASEEEKEKKSGQQVCTTAASAFPLSF